MTQPGLLADLPGGDAPLLSPKDPRLATLMQHSEEAIDELSALLAGPRTHKVGILFELLVKWGLVHGLGYTCLGQDVQIHSSTHTFGSLDLLLRSPEGHHEHWELAYKLYLQSDDGVGWNSWVGPGRQDRLDIKLQRLLNHQLALSARPEAQDRLRSLGVPAIDRRRVLLQGMLFTPWGSAEATAEGATRPAQGRWLRPSQVDDLLRHHPGSNWVQRARPMWFGPWDVASDAAVSSDRFREQSRTAPPRQPELWVMRSPAPQPYPEVFFLVPESWE